MSVRRVTDRWCSPLRLVTRGGGGAERSSGRLSTSVTTSLLYFVGCFCGFTGPNPAKLTVRNGVVVKVEAPERNSSASTPAGRLVSDYR